MTSRKKVLASAQAVVQAKMELRSPGKAVCLYARDGRACFVVSWREHNSMPGQHAWRCCCCFLLRALLAGCCSSAASKAAHRAPAACQHTP